MARAFLNTFAKCLRAYGGTQQQLAREVGVTPSTLSHVINGNASPSLELCLRLAAVTGISASQILRAAGKADLVDLIEGLYGAAAETKAIPRAIYSPDELQLLAKLRLIRPRSRRAVRTLVDACAFANGVLELPPGHLVRRLPATHLKRKAG